MAKFDAVAYAEQLSILKFFPSTTSGLAQVAAMLLELCKSEAQVEILVADVLSSCDEWPGPKTLREMYRERFYPEYRQRFIGPPPVDCRSCGDWGRVEAEGRYVRCRCKAGQSLPEEALAAYNRLRGKPMEAVLMASISQAEVDAEIERRKRRAN